MEIQFQVVRQSKSKKTTALNKFVTALSAQMIVGKDSDGKDVIATNSSFRLAENVERKLGSTVTVDTDLFTPVEEKDEYEGRTRTTIWLTPNFG